jgi:DNA-directed RNA polymerase specialized sigma24 family protein
VRPHFAHDPGAPRARVDGLLRACGSADAYGAAQARLWLQGALVDEPAADRLLAELRWAHGWSNADVAALSGRTEPEVLATARRLVARLHRHP